MLYESCACHVSAALQRRTSLSYSLSVEFVCICNSPKRLSYRFRRRATLAALHSTYAHSRGVADQMMVPSSPGGPDIVVCCTAATGLGRRSTSRTKPACAARWLAGTTLIIIIGRWRRTGCRTGSPLFETSEWTQSTGPATGAHSMRPAVRPSSSGCHPDASRT